MEVLKGEIAVGKQSQCLSPEERKFLHQILQSDIRPEYRRRIEIMLLADRGQSQAQICEALGCSPETARYWITVAQIGHSSQLGYSPDGKT